MQLKFRERYKELAVQMGQIPFARGEHGGLPFSKNGEWRNWATSAQNLIEKTFGANSPHSKNFHELYQKCNDVEHSVRSLFAVFASARSDFESGFAGNMDLRVSGEVFGDFVSLAKKSLSEGHKDVAAVLACAALEDALKRFASANGLDSDDKTMSDVINSLKGAGLVAGAQKTLLDAMPRIRNLALHADWGKLSEPDVNRVIGFVEQFLLTKFG